VGELVPLFNQPKADPTQIEVGDTAREPYSSCVCCSTQLNPGDHCDVCVSLGMHRCGKSTRKGKPCRQWTANPAGCPAHS
jgi:hypothetical protein